MRSRFPGSTGARKRSILQPIFPIALPTTSIGPAGAVVEAMITAEGLLRIANLVPSPWIGVNWDTGNSYLAGLEDPYEGLKLVRDKVRHVHAKDISIQQSEKERGKVTGTPVGCACGEGVVDCDQVLRILDSLDREIFLSVECGTIDQAERSLSFLRKVVGSSRLIE